MGSLKKFLPGFAGAIVVVTFLVHHLSTRGDEPPHVTREEKLLSDCEAIPGAGLWVVDEDGDGLAPELRMMNFQLNFACVVSGIPSGHIHITNANQIGLDADDMDGDVHFAE